MGSKISASFRICATCTHWCGRQMPDLFRVFVDYDMKESARCSGGGCNALNVNAMWTCPKWEQRFKK